MLENYIVREGTLEPETPLHGRRKILTSQEEITDENVISVLTSSLNTHKKNREEIQYLYDYVRGLQPILHRVKEERPEINNKIMLNWANATVSFKSATTVGKAINYVSQSTDKSLPKKLDKINAFMRAEDKQTKDMGLASWVFTCGVGYRFIGNDKWDKGEELEQSGEAPFELYNPEPLYTFCIYRNDITQKKLGAVHCVVDSENTPTYKLYTDQWIYTISGSNDEGLEVVYKVRNLIGMIPIVEYCCNIWRMGSFEPGLSILNAMNLAESNRLDAVEQFVQALLVIKNFDMQDEDINSLKRRGAIILPPTNLGQGDPDIRYLNEQLDQSQTQTLIDDMFQMYLQITGLPSQGNANTSDSSNNGAVIMKNGWWNSEARNLETESLWKHSDMEAMRIVLKICEEALGLTVKITDIDPKFGRHGYEDKMTKVQSFTMLIDAGCPPVQAFTISNSVDDPESAALAYEAYQKEKEAEMQKQLEEAQMNADKHSEETIVTEDLNESASGRDGENPENSKDEK